MFGAMMQGDGGGLALVLIVLLMFLFFASMVALTVFWVLMIVDCVKRKRLTDGERIAWILVLVFLQFLGAAIYYFAVKRAH